MRVFESTVDTEKIYITKIKRRSNKNQYYENQTKKEDTHVRFTKCVEVE